MAFKSVRGVIKLCVFCVIFLVLFVILTKVGISLEQRSLFTAALVAYICAALLYICFGVAVIVLIAKSLVTYRFWLALIYLGFFICCIPGLCMGYIVTSRIILNGSRPVFPERFVANTVAVERLTALSQEIISRRNILWVNNGWENFTFGIEYNDGTYVFSAKNVPENYLFNTPVKTEDIRFVRYLDLHGMRDIQVADSHLLNEDDYRFCAKGSAIIRRIGFHNIRFYPDSNVVRYQIRDSMGLDSPAYFHNYCYFLSNQLPDEFKNGHRLNDNWFYDSEPRP